MFYSAWFEFGHAAVVTGALALLGCARPDSTGVGAQRRAEVGAPAAPGETRP